MMRRAISPSVLLHISIWGVACAVYLALSVPEVVSSLASGSTSAITPYYSTDSYILSCARIPSGSAQVLRLFAALPSAKPVVVFIREGDDCGALISMIIAYLGWPRDVRQVQMRHANPGNHPPKIDPASLGAAIFFGMEPPPGWVSAGVRLGPNLVAVAMPAETKSP